MFDYVIIEKDEENKTTAGGLVLPENSTEKPSTGTVVAVGTGAICEQTGVLTPMYVSVGDRVLFPKLTGVTVKISGKEKTMLKQSNILGILK
jgi:chaperonin GroES